jgi:hypothetical protein
MCKTGHAQHNQRIDVDSLNEAKVKSHHDKEGDCGHRSSRADIEGPAKALQESISIRPLSNTIPQQPKDRRIVNPNPHNDFCFYTNNMPSLQSIALALAASFTLAQAEHLRVVWSGGNFGAIGGPGGGGESGGYDSFAIIRDDGEAVYTDANPGNYAPCFLGDGRTFEICGDCWDSCFRFKCQADFGGQPDSCEVQDGSGVAIQTGSAMTDTEFIGIAIGIESTCVVEFESDGGGCPVDDGNGPLHAQGQSV